MTQKMRTTFGWLNATQFLGALNDNVFKFLIIFFLTDHLGLDSRTTITIASAVFVVPFLLFSHAAGVIADRVSKRHVIVAAKVAELCIMLLGTWGIYLGSPILLFSILFLMCVQSAFFGPSKYGIIPELVRREYLSRANSFLVSLTYLAIILGTFLPSFILVTALPGNYLALAGGCVLLSIAGVVASVQIRVTAAARSKKRFSALFLVDLARTLRGLTSDRDLLLAVVGGAYFLFLGGFVQQIILLYGERCLSLRVAQGGYLFPVAALGIGVGALMSGYVSGRNIEFGIVPLGAMGLTVATIALGTIAPALIPVLVLMFVLGVSAGLFIVPLNAFIQYRSPPARRGEILACSNFLSFLGVALSALLVYVLTKTLQLTPRMAFLVVGLLTGVLACLAVWVLPDFLIRFCIISVAKTFYRIRVKGKDNIPMEGGALLVANHVTWVDALLISAPFQRRIRFLMIRQVYDTWWLRPLFRMMGVVPIAPNDPPRRVVESFRKAREAMDAGYLVCIFAEGGITRNGNMHSFKPGFERIVKGSQHPIIPIHIGGAWGSIFSYQSGKSGLSLPSRIPYPVSLTIGRAMPAETTPLQLRCAVAELATDDACGDPRYQCTLAQSFLSTARRFFWREALWDTTGKRLTFAQTLIASIALSDRLAHLTRGEKRIGVLLPSSVAGALVNLAVTLLGRTPVNINFTASAEAIASAIRQCDMESIVTSSAFLERLGGFQTEKRLLCMENIAADIGRHDKLKAALKAMFFSARRLARGRRVLPDDEATIIFSSGSTAEPKGVILSHRNLVANIASVRTIFKFSKADRFCAALPFFHSFGFTVTLWCPLVSGFPAFYHTNPLDAVRIGKMARTNRLTIMVATPTFLLAYIRRSSPDAFGTMRAVITGAEKLNPRVADAFEERFGVRPVEGYGTTELSPVAAVNIPDVSIARVKQVGTKEGSVGHPIPGVAARIIDPDAGTLLPEGEEGLLEIKGPNVMSGYLGRPDLTEEVVRDGWYNTGDIARIDRDGFIFLLDRMSRYSKIAGEMVPHIAVEEVLNGAADSLEPIAVVTAAPDEKRGEQLVVCFTDAAGTAENLNAIMAESEVPNLWKPRKENYVRVPEIPTLGSGKLDLKRLKEIARSHTQM